MKFTILALLLALNAHASESNMMTVTEFYDAANKDVSALINLPSLGGDIYFSSNSSQNGVCIALGYQKAAVGSIMRNYPSRINLVTNVVIDSNGTISRAERAPEHGDTIHKIICVNKVSIPQEKTTKVLHPKHLDAKVPFSATSDENGVCVDLGFKRAAVGSWRGDDDYYGPMVIVDSTGSVVSGSVAGYANRAIESLICIE